MPTDPALIALQDLRRDVRHYLATRPTIAQEPGVIHRHVRRERPCTLEQVEAALQFLATLDPPQVKPERDPLGASQYYQITAAGTLADERD